MSSRAAYEALTPEYSDFVLPTPSTSGSRLSNLQSPSTPNDEEDEFAPHESRHRFYGVLTRAKETITDNTGLLLVAAAQVFFSLMNVAVKKLNNIDPPVSALELVAVRMAITYICCITYMLTANVPDPFLGPKGVRMLLVFRGFTGFFGLFGVYFSLQYLSLSDATVLTFLAPMCTAVAGALLLGESFTRKEALASFVSLIGVVLIARPVAIFGAGSGTQIPSAGNIPAIEGGPREVTSSQRLTAVGVALVGVLGATGAYTSLRAIGKRAHPLHSLTSFSTQCVVVSSIAMIATRSKFVIPTQFDWLAMLAMIGVFGFIAQVLLTMGLQREAAGRGTMAVYTQVIFASILERIFFNTVPPLLSIFGTLMITSSAIYVVLTKENIKNNKSNSVSLRVVSEETLEEGLLERADDSSYQDSGKVEPTEDKPKNGDHEHDEDHDIVLPLFGGKTAP